jgi:aspartyl-tRNA(Asn)/glutamyl-tRNA(Gln) amidotransferase subunit C
MPLTDADVRSLAMLARLELSPEEVATIGPQLENILGFVEQLSELPTDEIDPMTTALDVVNRWSDDSPTGSLSRDKALQNSPLHDDEFFLVPPVLGVPG